MSGYTYQRILAKARVTIDHDTIRQWAEDRSTAPATVSTSADGDDAGILRIALDEVAPYLRVVTWDAWFKRFEEKRLLFAFRDDRQDGGLSRYYKLVSEHAYREACAAFGKQPRGL